MNEIPLTLKIPYAQKFVPRRCRNMQTAWFLDEGAVMIRDSEPHEAPVAHRIQSRSLPLDPSEPGLRQYDIRSFEGKFWWPIAGRKDDRYPWWKPEMDREQFADLAAEGKSVAVLAIDPSICIPLQQWPSREFGTVQCRTEGECDKGQRWAWAHRNALRVAFCGDDVLLECGEPVFYAVPCPGGVEIKIGPSAWDRWNEPHVLPGPDRAERLGCARQGLAFGLDEFDTEMRILTDRGNGVRLGDEIETILPHHRRNTAPLLCERALAEFLRDEARQEGYWTEHLRRNVPATAADDEPGSTLVHRRVLEQLAACSGPAMREFAPELRAARDILHRLNSFGREQLSKEDEAALGSLSL